MKKDCVMKDIKTIWDLLADAASDPERMHRLYKDAVNHTEHDREELFSDSKACAVWFLRNVPGDKIAFICDTSYEFIVAYYGCIGSGKTAVMINKGLSDETIAGLLDQTETTTVVYDARKERMMQINSMAEHEITGILLQGEENSAARQRKEDKQEDFIPDLDPEDMAVLVFTSGTTGKMKGVMLSHRNLVTNVFDIKSGTDYTKDDRVVSMLPPSHVFGLNIEILLITYLGTELIFEKNIASAFKNLPKTEPSVLIMVPMMVNLLAMKTIGAERAMPESSQEERKAAVMGRNLRAIGCGGAKNNAAIILKMSQYGVSCRPGYGLTELSPIVTINMAGPANPTADGKVVDSLKMRIKDGEIQLQGPTVAMGYYHAQDEWDAMWDGKWFKTGDLGYVDETGMLVLTGRKKNLIVTSSGENVSPEEIEEKYGHCPEITEVIVRAEGDQIIAELFAKNGITQERADEISAEVNRTQAVFARVMKTVIRTEEFQKNTAGKILRTAANA